jgi:hypothetical protein
MATAMVGSKWRLGLHRVPTTVNGGVGSSACVDRAVVIARTQLEERVSSMVLLRPW